MASAADRSTCARPSRGFAWKGPAFRRSICLRSQAFLRSSRLTREALQVDEVSRGRASAARAGDRFAHCIARRRKEDRRCDRRRRQCSGRSVAAASARTPRAPRIAGRARQTARAHHREARVANHQVSDMSVTRAERALRDSGAKRSPHDRRRNRARHFQHWRNVVRRAAGRCRSGKSNSRAGSGRDSRDRSDSCGAHRCSDGHREMLSRRRSMRSSSSTRFMPAHALRIEFGCGTIELGSAAGRILDTRRAAPAAALAGNSGRAVRSHAGAR